MPTTSWSNPAGRYAMYVEAPGGGDADDYAAPRHRPLADPVTWLKNVLLCSDFDYYQVAIGPVAAAITYAALAGKTEDVALGAGYTLTRTGDLAIRQYVLLNHNLGYVPRYMIAVGNQLLRPITIIKSGDKARILTPFATTTQIWVHEVALSGAGALAAQTIDYTVAVFRQPVADSNVLFEFDINGNVIAGLGKFNSGLKMLRRSGLVGDSPFDIPLARHIDIENGRVRTWQTDGTVVDELGYTGSFPAPPTFQGVIV